MFQSFHEAEEVAPTAGRGARLGTEDSDFVDAAGGAGANANAAGGTRRLRRFRP